MVKSSIVREKSKFLINRILKYFAFFLLPYCLQFFLKNHFLGNMTVLVLYSCFLFGQWYLIGREIDRRLKIYYRANSSMDRFLYRIVNGMVFIILFFGLINFLPQALAESVYWAFLVILGFFYSWPTRGKILEDSMSSQFYEFRFLDSFEKTVLYLTIIMFFVSIPEIPFFQNIEALKLYFDPHESIHPYYWNFLNLLYTPFKTNPLLFNLSWFFHIYLVGLGIFLIAVYSILRFFISRRLAILGVFSVVSSWSFSRQLDSNFISAVFSTFPVLWIWSFLWSTKSSTYRSGFYIGMVNFFGVILNVNNFFLLPLQLLFGYKFFMKDKTLWYKKQWLKYTLLGSSLCLITALTHLDSLGFTHRIVFGQYLAAFSYILKIKAFYILSPLGLLAIVFYLGIYNQKYFEHLTLDKVKLNELIYMVVGLFVLGSLFNAQLISSFYLMWLLSFLSLIPLEWIFRSISRLRSKRNIIYVMYILVCLLDSHFEGRIRIIGKLLLDDELLKYINQM